MMMPIMSNENLSYKEHPTLVHLGCTLFLLIAGGYSIYSLMEINAVVLEGVEGIRIRGRDFIFAVAPILIPLLLCLEIAYRVTGKLVGKTIGSAIIVIAVLFLISVEAIAPNYYGPYLYSQGYKFSRDVVEGSGSNVRRSEAWVPSSRSRSGTD